MPRDNSAPISNNDDALSALVNKAIRASDTGGCAPLEGLAAAEAYARLDLSAERPETSRKLAAVLLCRSGFERSNGNVDAGDRFEAEGIALIVIAARGQDLRATAALRHAGAQLVSELLADAAAGEPTAWAAQIPAGTC